MGTSYFFFNAEKILLHIITSLKYKGDVYLIKQLNNLIDDKHLKKSKYCFYLIKIINLNECVNNICYDNLSWTLSINFLLLA